MVLSITQFGSVFCFALLVYLEVEPLFLAFDFHTLLHEIGVFPFFPVSLMIFFV